MYVLNSGIKSDSERRWALPDRIFFGHGACHILAGVFIGNMPLPGFWAERIRPKGDVPGNHIYVTDGAVAFDYHGYSVRDRLLTHHQKSWDRQFPGWRADVTKVEFSLLSTVELNRRKMLGPDQYLHDPVPRAMRFIDRIDHEKARSKARVLIEEAHS